MPMKYYEQIKNQEIPPMDTGDVPAFLGDIVISEDTEKPITSGLFRLEKGESLTYTYTYHEMKLIVDGTLIIEDETGQRGWSSETIEIDQGNTSFPITMNFVGDIMMGRRFEDSDGIISTQGVEALFEPTIDLLGNAADITVANLEIPLTNQGVPHPTKGIVFRSAPENVSGLIYAGIDVVSLANNHILD